MKNKNNKEFWGSPEEKEKKWDVGLSKQQRQHRLEASYAMFDMTALRAVSLNKATL